MTEAIAMLADLTPIGAILTIAAALAVGLTQLAKQQRWTKQRTQVVALAISAVLGALAALVLGLIAGIPQSVIEAVSAVLLSIAAVVVLGRVLYGALGYVIPDGSTPEPTVSELARAQARIARDATEARSTAQVARAEAGAVRELVQPTTPPDDRS